MTQTPTEHLLSDEALERLADAALGPEPVMHDDLPLDPSTASSEAFRRNQKTITRGVTTLFQKGSEHLNPAEGVRLLRRKKAFVVALAQTGIWSHAAAAAGWSPSAARKARDADPEFAEMCIDALEFAADVAEGEAFRRGVNGVKKDVFFEGVKCGEEIVYSDRMLELILKSRKPEKFRESYKVEADVKGGVLVIPQTPSEDDWEAQAGAGQEQYRQKRD